MTKSPKPKKLSKERVKENADRVRRGAAVVQTFCTLRGRNPGFEGHVADITDVMTELHHYAASVGLPAGKMKLMFTMAEENYAEEIDPESDG